MNRAKDHGAFLLPLSIVFLILLFFRIDHQSLWLDEILSLEIARRDWSGMWAFLAFLPEQHPFYYLILRGWLLFGSTELALRSLSALFALGTLLVFYYLGRELFDKLTAQIAAVLLTFSPFFIYYGQEARMYTLLCFLAVLNSLLFVKWMRSTRRALYVGYLVTALLGIYTHFFFLLLLAAHFVFVVANKHRRSSLGSRFVLGLSLVGLLYSPWALLILAGGPESQDWKGASHVVFGLPYTLLRFSLGYAEVVANHGWQERVGELLQANGVLLIVAILCFGPLVFFGVRACLRSGEAGSFVLIAAVVPAFLALLGSLIVILVGERYLMVSFPFYLLLLAVGMARLIRGSNRHRMAAVCLVAVYAILVLQALHSYYFAPDFGKEQWAEVAGVLAANSHVDEPIIVHRNFVMPALEYYLTPNTTGPLYSSTDIPVDRLQSADRLWVVLSHPAADAQLENRLKRSYRVISDTLYPNQSGIRLLYLKRASHPQETAMRSVRSCRPASRECRGRKAHLLERYASGAMYGIKEFG